LVNASTSLSARAAKQATVTKNSAGSPWFRQVLVGGNPIGDLRPGDTANVPLYVNLADSCSLSGLQFRATVTPQNGAPAIRMAPQLILAPGVSAPSLQQSSKASELAVGWSLGSFSFQSRSSNFIGWLSFTIPALAASGQGYSVAFTNADGAPNLNTQYDSETRAAAVNVLSASRPSSVCSDDWKLHFFGSLTDPRSDDLADPDGDGVPNWMEFMAGTDPTDPNSRLKFTTIQGRSPKGELRTLLQWLTAPGKAYAVQSCSDLSSDSWTTSQIISGDGGVASFTEPSSPGEVRFYRLEVLP
jgi:hypothetical protein